MITYRDVGTTTEVRLFNKLIGRIKLVKGGYQYFPKGKQEGGQIFVSRKICKKSLES